MRVLVNGIRLTGNSFFNDEELAPIIAQYVRRIVITEEPHDLHDALTAHARK